MPLLSRCNLPTLHYEIDDYTDPWKNAPFILLQHGYGRSSKFWYRVVPYLSRFYKIIRPDLRGMGQSSTEFDLQQGINVDAYLEDMDAIIDSVGAESIHYCGESLGGILGVAFAGTRPHRVRTLNLISTPLFIDKSSQERNAAGYGSWEEAIRKLGVRGYSEAKNAGDRFAPGTDPGLMQWFANEQGKTDLEVMIAVQRLARRVDVTSYLPRINSPVLAVFPSHGPVITPEQEDLLRKNIKNLKMVHLPSTHHNLHCTQPAACALQVLHFAAQHDGISCHE